MFCATTNDDSGNRLYTVVSGGHLLLTNLDIERYMNYLDADIKVPVANITHVVQHDATVYVAIVERRPVRRPYKVFTLHAENSAVAAVLVSALTPDSWVVYGREKLNTPGWFKYGEPVKIATRPTREAAQRVAANFKSTAHTWVVQEIG